MEVEAPLNFDLAWRKTKRDYTHYMNSFTSMPYISDILDSKQDEWLDNLETKLSNGEYEPQGLRIVEVPKSGFHIRPASSLYIEDHVIYSSLLLEVYDDIRSEISWSANNRRFSHILLDDKSSSNKWEAFQRDPWKVMQDRKIELAQEYEYVLISDISGFYENIEVPTAISTIRQMGGDDEIVFALKDLLQIWAGPRNRGIPQGYGPSDILAEAYLNSIDRRMADERIEHIRYNDDFVIYTENIDRAISAQNLLERLLRERGLNIKSGKTSIYETDTALEWFEEPERIFEEIRERLETVSTEIEDEEPPQAVASTTRSEGSYGGGGGRERTPSEGEDEGESEDEPRYSIDVLEEAYQEHVEGKNFDDLDSHIFRFIINRLGRVDSDIAVEYCYEYIVDGRPDVRRILYNYFQKLSQVSEIADRLAVEITNQGLRYQYHEFTITRWFFDNDLDSREILRAARSILNRGNWILETRDYAVSILAEYGEFSDLELIESHYNQELRPTSKAVFAYALRHFEPMRRGDFYERMDSSHHIVGYSIERGRAES